MHIHRLTDASPLPVGCASVWWRPPGRSAGLSKGTESTPSAGSGRDSTIAVVVVVVVAVVVDKG